MDWVPGGMQTAIWYLLALDVALQGTHAIRPLGSSGDPN